MNAELPDNIRSKVFEYPIWTLLYHELNESLLVDCRGSKDNEADLFEVNLTSLEASKLKLELPWYEKMIGLAGDDLYTIEYQDENDPSAFLLKRTSISKKSVESVDELPELNVQIREPSLFELGTEYHQMIADFLSLELSLSCEYLEWKEYIIISYYLRSGEGFDRFLLLIKEGEKIWKIQQDDGMKGFSSGSFFVVKDQLVFVKDRNEVCTYSL